MARCRLTVSLALVLGVQLLAAGCNSTSGTGGGGGAWTEFNPEQGKFSIRMPAEPKPVPESDLRQLTAQGGWSVTSGPATYRITYRELNWGEKTPDQGRIDKEFDGYGELLPIVEGAKNVKTTRDVSVGKIGGGRQFDVIGPNGQSQRIQLCIFGDRLYRVDITGPYEATDNLDAQQYFSSFQVGK